MQVHLEQTKYVHHHGVEKHPKAVGEQIAEDNNFVGAGMSDSLTRRRRTDDIRETKPRRARSSRRDGVIFDKPSTMVVGPFD